MKIENVVFLKKLIISACNESEVIDQVIRNGQERKRDWDWDAAGQWVYTQGSDA